MKFVFPEFLWAFVLLTVPIVIHLFNFKRYKTLYFSSLTFLKSVTQQTKSLQKLKYWVTLLLRVLALSALILAFAQPFIPTNKLQGSTVNALISVYIDNSFSMQAKAEGGTLLSEAKEAAKTLSEKAPLGTNFMLLTNELSGSQFRLISKNEFQSYVDDIDFYPGAVLFDNLTKGIERTLELEKDTYQNQFILFSDFQVNALKERIAFSDTNSLIHPVRLIPQISDNIYIDSIWFDEPLRRIHTNNNLHVRIVNRGPILSNVTVDLHVNEYKRQTLVDLPQDGSVTVEFNYTDKTTGWKSGKVEVLDQTLYFDDAFYFSYEVLPELKVTILNDENSKKYPELVFQTEAYFKVVTTPVGQLQPEMLQSSDVLIINGLTDISSGLSQLIKDFLAENKSVVFIPSSGGNISAYNRLLSEQRMPVISRKAVNNLRLNQVSYEDVFFRGVFEKRPETMNLPKIEALFEPQATSKTNALPLVQLENGNSVFYRSGGSSKFYAFYFGLDDEFGKFYEHILFSTLLLRSGELSRSGNAMWFTHDLDEVVSIQRPSGFQGPITLKNDDVEVIPPARKMGNMDLLLPGKNDVNITLNQGHYGVFAGKELLGVVAVNLNRSESVTDYLTDEEIQQFIRNHGQERVGIQTISSVSDRDQFSINKPLEYWRILLILGLIFLVTEMLVTAIWRI